MPTDMKNMSIKMAKRNDQNVKIATHRKLWHIYWHRKTASAHTHTHRAVEAQKYAKNARDKKNIDGTKNISSQREEKMTQPRK